MSIRFRSSKKEAENGIANQDHFDLQFSIGARVRALAQARAGAQARASRAAGKVLIRLNTTVVVI